MIFKRNFTRTATRDGRLVYRRRQSVPAPLTVKGSVVRFSNVPEDAAIEYSFAMDGIVVAEGSGLGRDAFSYPSALRVPRGERDFLVVLKGFEPRQQVEGTAEIDVSLF